MSLSIGTRKNGIPHIQVVPVYPSRKGEKVMLSYRKNKLVIALLLTTVTALIAVIVVVSMTHG